MAVIGLLPATGILIVIYSLLEYVFGVKQYSGEPQHVAPLIPVPYLGHMLGLIRDKMSYYDKMTKQNSLPIFTVPAFGGGRMYVINAPELVLSVFRNFKSFSFAALAVDVVARVSSLSSEGAAIVSKNAVSADSKDGGYAPETFKVIHSTLAPGEGLDEITADAHQLILKSLETLKPTNEGRPVRIKMFEWMRHEIAMATTGAFYGPLNPFTSSKVEQAFWDFENEFTSLLVGLWPSVTSAKGFKGRARVQEALDEYFQQGGHKNASKLIQARYNTAMKHGLSSLDAAKLEATMSIAILGTTAPSAFWMLYYAFSNQSVLMRLREEIDPLIVVTQTANGTHRTISPKALIKDCPFLSSTWQEMLRHAGCSTSARKVLSDTVLPDGSLLKQGGVIQMPSRSSHMNVKAWGPTVNEFDAGRFLKGSGSGSKVPAGTFRPFSGGNTLCPGRHLAAAEILAIVGMIVARFELTPIGGSKWVQPEQYASSIGAAIYSPSTDPEVDVISRKGFEEGTWAFADPTPAPA